VVLFFIPLSVSKSFLANLRGSQSIVLDTFRNVSTIPDSSKQDSFYRFDHKAHSGVETFVSKAFKISEKTVIPLTANVNVLELLPVPKTAFFPESITPHSVVPDSVLVDRIEIQNVDLGNGMLCGAEDVSVTLKITNTSLPCSTIQKNLPDNEILQYSLQELDTCYHTNISSEDILQQLQIKIISKDPLCPCTLSLFLNYGDTIKIIKSEDYHTLDYNRDMNNYIEDRIIIDQMYDDESLSNGDDDEETGEFLKRKRPKILRPQHDNHSFTKRSSINPHTSKCEKNYHVINGICTACKIGSTRMAGDDPMRGDTSCECILRGYITKNGSFPTVCLCDIDYYVHSFQCVRCPKLSIKAGGDNPAQGYSESGCDPDPNFVSTQTKDMGKEVKKKGGFSKMRTISKIATILSILFIVVVILGLGWCKFINGRRRNNIRSYHNYSASRIYDIEKLDLDGEFEDGRKKKAVFPQSSRFENAQRTASGLMRSHKVTKPFRLLPSIFTQRFTKFTKRNENKNDSDNEESNNHKGNRQNILQTKLKKKKKLKLFNTPKKKKKNETFEKEEDPSSNKIEEDPSLNNT